MNLCQALNKILRKIGDLTKNDHSLVHALAFDVLIREKVAKNIQADCLNHHFQALLKFSTTNSPVKGLICRRTIDGPSK